MLILSISPQAAFTLDMRGSYGLSLGKTTCQNSSRKSERYLLYLVVYHKGYCKGNRCKYPGRGSGRASGAEICLSNVGFLPASEYVCLLIKKTSKKFWGKFMMTLSCSTVDC